MAFPVNSVTSLEGRWSQIKNWTGRIKDQAVTLNNAVNITRTAVLQYQNFLADALAALNTLTANASTNGLLEYARAQENNPTLDLVTEYNTMRTQLVAVQDWTVNNFPKDASNNLAVYVFDVNKRYGDVNLTAGQLSAYKKQLVNLAKTIR